MTLSELLWMISPIQQSTSLSHPITLGELQNRCDVMEGYVDLGMIEEAIKAMRNLTSELRLADEGGELFLNVLTKTHPPLMSAIEDARPLTHGLCLGRL